VCGFLKCIPAVHPCCLVIGGGAPGARGIQVHIRIPFPLALAPPRSSLLLTLTSNPALCSDPDPLLLALYIVIALIQTIGFAYLAGVDLEVLKILGDSG